MTDVLFHDGTSDYDFSGKLPFSWPRNTKQANLNYFDATSNPLFNFGYGLTYKEEIFINNLDGGEDSKQKIDSIELMKQTFEDHSSKEGSIIFSSHQNPGIYVTEEINL